MKGWWLTGMAVAVLLVLLAYSSVFVVGEGQQAILLQFGHIVRDDYAPGAHIKWPLLQQVLRFDDRVLSLDPQPEDYSTLDNNHVNVDYYATWRIVDRGQYYRSSHADLLQADQRLAPIVKESLGTQIAKLTLAALIEAGPQTLNEPVRAQVDAMARQQLGISVIDLGIKQISLPDALSEAVYKRMREERQLIASQLRAEGNEQAATSKAEAQRQAEQIQADADRDAAKTRGEGDAQAAAIYAQAYQQDPDFYAFYRSLESYRKAFDNGRGVFVLKSDAEFLRYFNESAVKH